MSTMSPVPQKDEGGASFYGYIRPDGKIGTRNYVLVIPSVGCSQGAASAIVRGIKNAVYLPNVLGCGQVGEDRLIVKKTLAGFGINPNVYGVLVVGNGCEHLSAEELANEIRSSGKPVEVLVIQEVGGTRKTIREGRRLIKEMVDRASKQRREPAPLEALIVGTECGGSDYTSGLASNPAVGVASNMLIDRGATVILSETPELIGAEHILAARAKTPHVAKRIFEVVEWWERKALEAGQNIRESNPSPGNIEGGITTLEEKSLGCIYKGGTGTVEEVIPYASIPSKKGLVYMDTPAHDIEQLTGMAAGGAQVILFTTGRGTPVGSPIVPVIKITGNKDLFRKMRDNIDLDVSTILSGKESVTEAGERIFKEVIAVASGKPTKAERLNQRDFCIFKMYMNI
ncbi:MAG: UxaA family hydrolase [Syntrophorhabdaceae bacterium]|nr:UxaA family hydrolase [Syntrophorhabdaceae bacterium]